MINKGTVYLETDRLILRRFEANDLDQIYNNCWKDYDVWKWTRYKPMNTIKDVKEKAKMFTNEWLNAYEKLNRYSWAIVLKETGEVIGRYFGMHPDEELEEVELAYEIGSKWWNQGLITESTKRIIKFFFEDVKINRIFCYHASSNLASGRVMQKCDMIKEGVLREGCWCNLGVFDKVIYAILAKDYYKNK